MSLMDALLLDPYQLDIWVAPRTDGVIGSGTEEDPFDGGTRPTTQKGVTIKKDLTATGVAKANCVGHGFQDRQLVLITGATGDDAKYYNGTFSITYVDQNNFKYTMWGTPTSDATGTTQCQVDPYMFDSVMRGLPMALISLVRTTTASPPYVDVGDVVASVANPGFTVGDIVLITGATGNDAAFYNGIFPVKAVDTQYGYYFTYRPSGPDPQSNTALGNVCCRLYQFDALARPVPNSPPVAVRLGPGLIQTKGYTPLARTSWIPRSGVQGTLPSRPPETVPDWLNGGGMKIIGSGMGVTVLQLVGAVIDDNLSSNAYYPISEPFNNYHDGFEARDFTVDCNLAGQPSQSVTCGGIVVNGTHNSLRRIRVINFGPQGTPESFLLGLGSREVLPDGTAREGVANWILDCINEQPGLNSVYSTTCLGIGGDLAGRYMIYARAAVIRNCYVNCELRQNPVQIAGIIVSGGLGLASVTTALPHGHANGDWVVISGVMLNGTVYNAFNGSYKISSVSTYGFQYTPIPTQPDGTVRSGNMWVGISPNQVVQIKAITVAGPPWLVTVTTWEPHYLVPGRTVVLSNVVVSAINGPHQVSTINVGSSQFNPSTFTLDFATQPALPGPVTIGGNEFIGVGFQGGAVGLGTAGVYEGNRILNCTPATYGDSYSTKDQIYRNNYFRGVSFGNFLLLDFTKVQALLPPISLTYSQQGAIFLATATIDSSQFPDGHGISVGEVVHISGASINAYNGFFFVTVATKYTFTYVLPSSPNGSTSGNYGRLAAGGKCVYENNIMDMLAAESYWYAGCGIQLGAGGSTENPVLFPQALMRRNVIRHVDGLSDPLSYHTHGLFAFSCTGLIAEENVVDLDATAPASPPVQFSSCGSVEFFANQTSAGNLLQGYTYGTTVSADELTTNIEDAAIFAF